MNGNRMLLATALLTVLVVRARAQSTIQFTATGYSVAESAGSATLTVQRTGDTNTPVSVDYATADVTATNGFKYTAVSGTLAFTVGETNKIILVPILDEGFVEGTTIFRVILSNPSSEAVLGTRTNAIVNITDNDVGVQFQFATYAVAEDAGAVSIALVRGDDGTNAVTVDLITSNGTATSGVDYTGLTNTLMFAPQERVKFISIPILNNTLKQGNRTFGVALSNPVGLNLASQKAATITIEDNDQGFAFEFGSYSVAEDAGVAWINVLRGTDDTNSTVTVDVATADLTATNGFDYVGVAKPLSFAPGERVKTVVVPILNNGFKQPDRNFSLTLSNPSGARELGSRTNATVSIMDNDQGLGFERTLYTNAWGDASGITLTVLRGNDWDLGMVTVDYTTSDLTAKAGQDYQAVSGTLVFQENETIRTLTIPLLRPRVVQGVKGFMVTLTNAAGASALGTATAIVKIVGAYSTVAPPFDTALNIQRIGSLNMLAWIGGGVLQRADQPWGPWQTLSSAKSPYTVQSRIPSSFYRVTRPRAVNVYVPSAYDGRVAMPLVILLHGYGGTGADVESYLHFEPLAEARGFLYCFPDGTIDRWGNRFWNATDACCDFWSTGINDAGYLRALIQEIQGQFLVEAKRFYLVCHANGGFMAYRMACQSADLVAGIASLAGGTFLDPGRCAPSQPVNILQIHGTADAGIRYAGGAVTTANPAWPFPWNESAIPGALSDVQLWAGYNGASGPMTDPAPSLDLTTDVAGLDTVITRYTNSPPGGAVELWTIIGGSHNPAPSPEFSPHVIDWLLAHPKP